MNGRLVMLVLVYTSMALGWSDTAGMLAWMDMIGLRLVIGRRK